MLLNLPLYFMANSIASMEFSPNFPGAASRLWSCIAASTSCGVNRYAASCWGFSQTLMA
jgi:hypothetical protein